MRLFLSPISPHFCPSLVRPGIFVTMFAPFVVSLLALAIPMVFAQNPQVHDASFAPDSVLRISKIDASIACAQRESVVVNGTTPGPVVELTAGKPNWIRVYNDMTDDNATIASTALLSPRRDGDPNKRPALAWPKSECCAFLVSLQCVGSHTHHTC